MVLVVYNIPYNIIYQYNINYKNAAVAVEFDVYGYLFNILVIIKRKIYFINAQWHMV